MPNWIWLILVSGLLVLVGSFVTHPMLRVGFYVLALVVAIAMVVRLIG